VRHSDVKPYWNLAEQFGLADEMLQANEGPSFAAHQYLIAAQSGHPWAMTGIPFPQRGACGVPGNKVAQIDMRTPYPGIIGNVEAPCKDYGTVLDLLVDKGFTWRYYTPFQSYLYNAPFAIRHIYFGPTASNDVIPEFSILTDIKSHHLASVSYVVSHLQLTDHPGVTSPNGPYWIATLANAIFENPYYKNNTVMFVTWDDWGGFFDHVVPRHPDGLPNDPYEYGFRVPLIAISPFVRTPHFVDHTPRDQTAIVHFIETNFGLRTLGELDAKTDDLSSMFDFSRSALPYTNVDTNGWVPNDALQYPIEQGVD
jgi:phospholipase C